MGYARWALVAAGLLAGLVVGLLLGAQAAPAVAQPALTAPLPVVAAVPFQSRTDYEQDPFETTRVRRTNTTLLRVLLVRQDGKVEVKEVP